MSSSLILFIAQAGHENPPPIIDFDGTILLQFILFLLTYFVLNHLVFKPYLKVRKEREQATIGTEEEAVHLTQKASLLSNQYKKLLEHAKIEVEKERLVYHNANQKVAQETLLAASQETASLLSQERTFIKNQQEQARRSLDEQSRQLGNAIVEKILGKTVTS